MPMSCNSFQNALKSYSTLWQPSPASNLSSLLLSVYHEAPCCCLCVFCLLTLLCRCCSYFHRESTLLLLGVCFVDRGLGLQRMPFHHLVSIHAHASLRLKLLLIALQACGTINLRLRGLVTSDNHFADVYRCQPGNGIA